MNQAAFAVQGVSKSHHRPLSIAAETSRFLGVKAVGKQALPGRSNYIQRLKMEDGRTLIATHRKLSDRTDPECLILESLAAHDAPVPGFIGKNDQGLFLQQDLRGVSLPQWLSHNSAADYSTKVVGAVKNLAKIQRLGSHVGLEEQLPLIGETSEWLEEFIHYPAKLGAKLNIRPAAPDLKGLRQLLEVQSPRFIKWNARPTTTRVIGNDVYWADWERAAVRQRLDDLVWFFGDETMPERPEEETRLIKAFLPYFADSFSQSEAHDYFYSFGALHISVRLGVALRHRGETGWLDKKAALAGFETALYKPWIVNLCSRGQRWAQKSDYVASLAPWFRKLGEYLGRLD